ncbi:MAG: hypothetical protein LBF64_02615 [Oscillospiraceae bacterium]|nr:hypothetical protein [Oscillospiraceae bacterium]
MPHRRCFARVLCLCLLLSVCLAPMSLSLPAPAPQRPAAASPEAALLAGLEAVEGEIDLSPFRIPVSDINALFWGIVHTHPELFYVENFGYTYLNGCVLTFKPVYTLSKELVAARRPVFARAVAKALAAVPKTVSPAEKVLAVNDYLVSRTAYDLTYAGATAYDALVNRAAVCEGYSLAFGLLMDRLGIEWRYISSAKMSHAWNLVRLDGAWYHVDVTWNDPIVNRGARFADMLGRVHHEYLLIPDSVIGDAAHKHTGWSPDTPKATSTKYVNAFWTDVPTEIIHEAGKWYYIPKSNGQTHTIRAYDFRTGASAAVHTIQARWNAPENNTFWVRTPYLARYGNRLFYNTPDRIFSLRFDGTDVREVWKTPLSGLNAIYEMTIWDGVLHHRVSAAPQAAAVAEKQWPLAADTVSPTKNPR